MHLMGMALDELRSKGVDISAAEEESALIALLLHDIGHSPYSHALEGLIIHTDHESIGKLIIRFLQKELGGGELLALEMFEGRYHRPFFHQLISGQLDLDRLDYLSRDSFYTGVAEGVIGHDRLMRMLHVVNDHLVVEEKGLHSIEKFLVARRIMYWQVYLHKTVLAAELMSKNILRLLRNESPESVLPYLSEELAYFLYHYVDLETFKNNFSECIGQFQQLDDVSLDYSFKRLTDHPSRPIRLLTKGLVNRKLHKIQWSADPVPVDAVSEMTDRVSEKYQLPKSIATELVWTGSESNIVYTPQHSEIMILTKEKEIKPFSSFLLPAVEVELRKKHFLCYPS